MGDACRSDLDRRAQFALAARTVRLALLGQQRVYPVHPEKFWEVLEDVIRKLEDQIKKEDKDNATTKDKLKSEQVVPARIAALMQILGPEPAPYRVGLVKYLTAIKHPEATRALARLAVYSAEDEVRLAAIDALLTRKERNYTDVLLGGLKYPWPKVARNAADAIVHLKRDDLMPQLVALLEETDPRAPQVAMVDSKQVTVVKELVRINHNRNCAMCHAPGIGGEMTDRTLLTAQVPTTNRALPSIEYYRPRLQIREMLVRVDMTYLRQDFSVMQAVPNAKPWPEMQRFDFLVRTRQVEADEAAAYRTLYAGGDPASPSPYQQTVLAALREMTGRDAAPTAAAWRKVLKLPTMAPGMDKAGVSNDAPIRRQRRKVGS